MLGKVFELGAGREARPPHQGNQVFIFLLNLHRCLVPTRTPFVAKDIVHPTPATLEAVVHDALVLPPEQRLALARQLLKSVELEPESGAEAAWETEISQRIAHFQSGESKSVAAGEVFARLREIAPDRPDR